jgi:hypothetical protein
MSSVGSTGHFRRTCGLNPHVLMVGAAESAP